MGMAVSASRSGATRRAVGDQLAADEIFRRGVDRLDRGHGAVAQMEDREFARRRIAAQHDLVARLAPGPRSAASDRTGPTRTTALRDRASACRPSHSAACLAWSIAFCTHSSRIAIAVAPDDAACNRPPRRSRDRRCVQTSSTTMPSSQSRPAASAISQFGTTPMPTSAISAAIASFRRRARLRACPSPSKAFDAGVQLKLHAGVAMDALIEIRHRLRRRRAPSRGPSLRTP